MVLNVVIVDDEPIARQGLQSFVSKMPNLRAVGAVKDIASLLEILHKEPVDLIFMDIEMPGITGIEFVETYQEKLPMIIFVTAYHQYAVKSYDLHAVDYLLKPVSFERFHDAVSRAVEIAENASQNVNAYGSFFVRHDGQFRRVNPDELVMVAAMQNYLKLHLRDEKPLIIRSTMKEFQNRLDPGNFLMVHRSYIVNTQFVESTTRSHLTIPQIGQIPIGNAYSDDVLKRLLK